MFLLLRLVRSFYNILQKDRVVKQYDFIITALKFHSITKRRKDKLENLWCTNTEIN